jgi:hypothetical protein
MRLQIIKRPISATQQIVAHVRLGGEPSREPWEFDASERTHLADPRFDVEASDLRSRLAGAEARQDRQSRPVTDVRCPFDAVTRAEARLGIATNAEDVLKKQRAFANRRKISELDILREQLKRAIAQGR